MSAGDNVQPGDRVRLNTDRDVRCWHERNDTTELLLETDLVSVPPNVLRVPSGQVMTIDHAIAGKPWLPAGDGPWFLASFPAGLDRWQTVVQADEVDRSPRPAGSAQGAPRRSHLLPQGSSNTTMRP